MKRRVLTFRDKYNKLHSHENYYPVVNMVSPVKIMKITGKRHETIKDFVTSILMKRKKINSVRGITSKWKRIINNVKNKFKTRLQHTATSTVEQ